MMEDRNLGRTPLENKTEYLLFMESQNIIQQPNKAASLMLTTEDYWLKKLSRFNVQSLMQGFLETIWQLYG